MPLAALLTPAQVVTDLRVGSVARLLQRLAALLVSTAPDAARSQGPDEETILLALRAREALSPTALGHGIALPHAAIPGLEHPRIVFARLATPLVMDAPDAQPVDLVCALLVPDGFIDGKLRLLAEVAETLEHPGTRIRLRTAPDAAALHAVLVHTTQG